MGRKDIKIAVLAVQGAFIEHEKMLAKLGIKSFEIRQKKDLEQDFDGLILPGGESTVMGKLLRELDLFETLKSKIEAGLPVFGTCAGLILLADNLSNDDNKYFGTLPVTVKRNAYGRQLGSFFTRQTVKGIGEIPMAFIRAPYIEKAEKDVDVIASVDNNIVGVRYKNQLGISFHPEVTDCAKIHEYFIDMVENAITA
jgi:5'-phosphate synthase pdxT subunit